MRFRPIILSLLTIPSAALFVVSATPLDAPIIFEDARMIIEFNDTDQDVGMQIFLDSEGWRSVTVVDPNGKTILDITSSSGLKKQGLGELFFESAEPPLDEVSLAQFFDRFPEGMYRFSGKTIDNENIRGTAVFTHRIPDAPVIVQPVQNSTVNPNNTVVDWNPVANPAGGHISSYQVIVTQVLNVLPEREFSVFVPATVTRVTVPAEFLTNGAEYDLEVLAIEAGGNQSITTGHFSTALFSHPNDK